MPKDDSHKLWPITPMSTKIFSFKLNSGALGIWVHIKVLLMSSKLPGRRAKKVFKSKQKPVPNDLDPNQPFLASRVQTLRHSL